MSKEKKYTPGPWKVMQNEPQPWRKVRYVGGIKGGDNGRNVVNWGGISRGRSDEALANARLIAAAPDLLEALEAIAKNAPTKADFELGGKYDYEHTGNSDDEADKASAMTHLWAANIARAAIAKALGE